MPFEALARFAFAGQDLQYKEALDKPVEREVLALTKKSGIDVMKVSFRESLQAPNELTGVAHNGSLFGGPLKRV